MKTMEEFIKSNGIKMRTEKTFHNPNMEDSDRMNHWKITLRFNGRKMSFVFSQGLGIKHDPSLPDVLDCLASDASGIENSPDFEEWARAYGYDEDSRKAEKLHTAVRNQSRKLKALFRAQYDTLLFNTERE